MEWKKGKKGIIQISIFLGILITALVYLIFVPRPVKVEVAQVKRGRFIEIIQAAGILRSKERYTVPAFGDGDIRRVSLKVGDSIKRGEIITELNWSMKYLPVRAPIGGIISKVYRESAGPIRRGEPIVEIIDPTKLELMAELLTTEAVRLRIGAIAKIENLSQGSEVQARVTRISKAGYTKLSALGVEEERTEVIAELINFPPEILENIGSTFHVDVTFIVHETPNALKIPVGALFRDGEKWAVYLAEKGRAKKKNVEVGAIGAQEALIKLGLHIGEKVLIYPGDLVKPNSRIKTK